MLPFSRSELASAGIGAALTLAVTGPMALRRQDSPTPPPLPAVSAPARVSGAEERAGPPGTSPTPSASPIVVHVAGCVWRPGVYTFREGDRVCDAVRRAGGAKPRADLDAINLAARLEDGRQLYLPAREETRPARSGPAPSRRPASSFWTPPAAVRVDPIPPGRMPLARPEPAPAEAPRGDGEEAGRSEKIHTPAEGRVNINRADAAELQRLPHVGPATAQRILEYRREHGPFRSVEQLLEVRGIGPKRLAELRDLVEL